MEPTTYSCTYLACPYFYYCALAINTIYESMIIICLSNEVQIANSKYSFQNIVSKKIIFAHCFMLTLALLKYPALYLYAFSPLQYICDQGGRQRWCRWCTCTTKISEFIYMYMVLQNLPLQSSGYQVIWPSRHLAIRPSGHLDFWPFGLLAIWPSFAPKMSLLLQKSPFFLVIHAPPNSKSYRPP